MGNRMSSSYVQWGVVVGVQNMAQAVGVKLTENGETDNKKEQFPTSTYAELHKIMQALTQAELSIAKWTGRN